MKVVAFDVSSPLAQFRKGYSTTSTLTFSIAPPSAVRGLIGAILGMTSAEIPDRLAEAKVGISVMSEVSKSRITANYINTKLGISPAHISGPARTQIRVEYVREPRYRIYFSVDDTEIMNRLREMLVAHKSHFTPYLGTACCIAQVTWHGEYDVTPATHENEVSVRSAVPRDWIVKMSVKQNSRYMVERVPVLVDRERTPMRYVDLVFDARGGPITGVFSRPLVDIGGGCLVALI